jgi:hypothetical protein
MAQDAVTNKLGRQRTVMEQTKITTRRLSQPGEQGSNYNQTKWVSRQIDTGAGSNIIDGSDAGTRKAVQQVGPSSSKLVAHPNRDGATTGVCWSFSDSGTHYWLGQFSYH